MDIPRAENPPSEAAFLAGLRANAARIGGPAAHKLMQLWYGGTAPETPARVKAVFYGALGYFLLPLDAVPDFLPLVGWGDDLTIVAGALLYAQTHITEPVKARAAALYRSVFGVDP